MRMTLTADIPDEIIREGTAADVLTVIARDYYEKGAETGRLFGTRWVLTFEEEKRMKDETDLDDIVEAQGWTDSTLLTVLTDFLHNSGQYENAVTYAKRVARIENGEDTE